MQTLSISNSKSALPKAALAAIGFILLMECIVFRLVIFRWILPYDHSRELTMWDLKQKLVESGRMNSDILFLGDSKTLGGINAKVFEQGTGMRAYNLSLAGMQPVGHYFLLRRYFQHNKKPRILFYSPSAFLLEDHIEEFFSDRFCRYFIKTGEMSMLLPDILRLPEGKAKKPILEFLFKNTLITYSLRFEIRALAENAWKGSLQDVLKTNKDIVDGLQKDNGFCMWHHGGALTQGQITKLYQENASYKGMVFVSPSPMNSKYIQKIFDLCRVNGTRVVFSFGPEPEELYRIREQLGVNANMHEFVAALAKRNPQVEWLDPLILRYADDCFFDISHVNEKGVQQWTQEMIAQYSRKYSAGTLN